MPCCWLTGTLSVPMSNRRYTAVESQLTTSPWKRRASAMPNALLPVAVGPTIATRRGRAILVPRECPDERQRDKRGKHQQQTDLLCSRRSDHDPAGFSL